MEAIYQKLGKIAAHCAYIRKDGVNLFHKYNYATAAQIFEKVGEALQEAGVVSVPVFSIHSLETRTTAKGSTETIATVDCSLRLIDCDTGQSIDTHSFGSGQDNGDKAVMKAQTAALKYAWMMLLNISTGDDPEADATVDARMEGVSIKAKQGVAPRGKVSQAVPEPLPEDTNDYDSEGPAIFQVHTPDEVAGFQRALATYKATGVDPGDDTCDCGSPIVDLKNKTGKAYRSCDLSAKAFRKDPEAMKLLESLQFQGKHHWKWGKK